jgi:ABC-2 type transport system permease protein
MIGVIARRELANLFHSPFAWVLLAANQFLLAWIFLRILERFSGLEAAQRHTGISQELALNLFSFAGALALFSAPLLTMRVFSEEMRNGSFALLASAPLSDAQILLGKLLGLGGMLLALSALPLLLSLSIWPWATLDPGLLLAAALGLILAYWLFACIGLFFSALTRQPTAAAAGAYALLLLLSLINRAATSEDLGGVFINWLAWNEHFLPFLMGLVQTSDIAYFVLLGLLFLALAWRRLARRRVIG